MKTLRQLSGATILSLTLVVSVFAGHIETPGAKDPVPTPSLATTSTTTTSTSDVITSILLTILGLT